MTLDIILVKEDLMKPVLIIGHINEPDIRTVYEAARELNLSYILILDPWGDTIINRSGREILAKELEKLRKVPAVAQNAVDLLQLAIAKAHELNLYIKSLGD